MQPHDYLMHTDMLPQETQDALMHYGVRGMKWGVKRAGRGAATAGKATGHAVKTTGQKFAGGVQRAKQWTEDHPYTTAAIGAGLIGAGGLASYGAYKAADNMLRDTRYRPTLVTKNGHVVNNAQTRGDVRRKLVYASLRNNSAKTAAVNNLKSDNPDMQKLRESYRILQNNTRYGTGVVGVQKAKKAGVKYAKRRKSGQSSSFRGVGR